MLAVETTCKDTHALVGRLCRREWAKSTACRCARTGRTTRTGRLGRGVHLTRAPTPRSTFMCVKLQHALRHVCELANTRYVWSGRALMPHGSAIALRICASRLRGLPSSTPSAWSGRIEVCDLRCLWCRKIFVFLGIVNVVAHLVSVELPMLVRRVADPPVMKLKQHLDLACKTGRERAEVLACSNSFFAIQPRE